MTGTNLEFIPCPTFWKPRDSTYFNRLCNLYIMQNLLSRHSLFSTENAYFWASRSVLGASTFQLIFQKKLSRCKFFLQTARALQLKTFIVRRCFSILTFA
jgi:hypothetical protein